MKNNKHKILVLSDLNESTSKTLISGVSLAKIVEADINFFYVKKATEVVDKDNQLSAIRTINENYRSIDKKINCIINPISDNYNVNINHTFTIGNVKNEIGRYIDENKPDIIVLGKRKSKRMNFIDAGITDYILKNYKGVIMISDAENSLEPNKELSLGMFNNVNPNSFIESIIRSTQKTIRSFKIVESSRSTKQEMLSLDKNRIEYVFVKGDNAIKNISNYLSKSNTNLLFVNREKKNSNSKQSNIKEVIKTLNCSIILTT
ncbi:MAG: hypothetical protein ACI9SI_000027 [Polaribacter sp.]|jgi:hypothetical protein